MILAHSSVTLFHYTYQPTPPRTVMLRPTKIDLIHSIDAWDTNYDYKSPPILPTGDTKKPETNRMKNIGSTMLYIILTITAIISITIFPSNHMYMGDGGRFVRGNTNMAKDPTFIIHVSTTTATGLLGCVLARNKDLLSSTSKYRYLNSQKGCDEEEENMESLHDDVNTYLEDGDSPIYTSTDIGNDVLQVYRQGKNTTIFNSNMKNTILPLLHRVEESESNWKTQIIMEYQRYYELIPVHYHHQLESFVKGASYRDLYSYKMKTLLSIETFINAKEEAAGGDFGSTVHPLQLYRTAFRDVLGVELEVVNPYPSQPESIENNDPLCSLSQVLQGSEEFHERYTGESELDTGYMHLTIAAYSMGLVSVRSGSPWNMVQTLVEHHGDIMHILDCDIPPLYCVSEEILVNLYESSARFEKELFEHWSDQKLVREHHLQGFTRDVEDNKFCEWDVKQMLNNGKLRDLIRQLSSSSKPATKLKIASLWKDEL